MKSIWKWVLFFVAVFLVVFIIAVPLFIGRFAFGVMPMMGGSFRGYPMYGMHGGFGLIGIAFKLVGFLIFVGILTLAVVGIVSLFKSRKKTQLASETPPTIETQPCAKCGKSLQADWTHCPYCGQAKA